MQRREAVISDEGRSSAVTTSSSRAALPLLVLALAIAWSAVDLDRDGSLATTQHPDTPSYLKSVEATALTEVLAHYRTYGYPLFLKTLGWLELGWPALPYVQAAAFYGAVLLFFFAVREYGGSPWLALVAALPLAFAEILPLAGLIQPDFLSAALALTAISLLLLLTAGIGGAWLWAALALAIFAAYQVRPATVFLIGWIPIAGYLLCRVRIVEPSRRGLRFAVLLAAVALVPYLSFAGLRLAVVGHFGLVSFGGYNLSALAACFIDQELVASLEGDQRNLATRILNRRERRGWRPMTVDDRGDSLIWFEQYNDNLWRITLAAAWIQLRTQRQTLRRLRAAGDPVERAALLEVEGTPPRVLVNQRLTDLAHTVLRRRPALYLRWVRDAILYGLARTPDSPWIRWPALLLGGSLVAAAVGRGHRGRWGREEPERAAVALAFAGLGYAALYLLLTCLVSFPFERYYLSITLLVPSSLTLLLYALWRRRIAAWMNRFPAWPYRRLPPWPISRTPPE